MLDYFRDLKKSEEEKQQEALNAYLDGSLAPQQRRKIEQELAANDGLKSQLEQMRTLKQEMRQLPRRQVPRNFVLDPALYGRPAREPLVRAYPILRTATVLTAFIFVFLLAANVYLAQEVNQSAESAAPMAMMAEQADMAAAEETLEIAATPEMEVVEEEAAAEEAAAEAAPPAEPGTVTDEMIGGEMTMPAEVGEAPLIEEPAPEAGADDEGESILRQAVPEAETSITNEVPAPEPTMAAAATELTQALPTVEQETVQEFKSTTPIEEQSSIAALFTFPVLLLFIGIVFIALILLTLLARRRL